MIMAIFKLAVGWGSWTSRWYLNEPRYCALPLEYIVLICLNSFVVFWKPDRVNFVPDSVMGPKFTLHFRVWYSTHSMGYFQAEVAIIFKLPTQVWNLYSFLFALHPIFGKIILSHFNRGQAQVQRSCIWPNQTILSLFKLWVNTFLFDKFV